MRRIKHKNGFSYRETFWNGSDVYDLKATHYAKATKKPGYKVVVMDGLETPDLGGNTPQIAFARMKKYLQEKFPADPEALAFDKKQKNFLRRNNYYSTKKKSHVHR